MRALFFMVCLVACKTSHVLDVASHADAATAAQIETHQVKSEGPEHIVMTVEEFSQLCDPKDAIAAPRAAGAEPGVGSLDLTQPHHPGGTTSTASPSGQSLLVRRTVTVTDRGPSLDDLRTISSLQSKLNSATTVKTKDESKPGGIFALWPLLVAALPIAGGALLWKFKPTLITAAWAALKSLFGRKDQ